MQEKYFSHLSVVEFILTYLGKQTANVTRFFYFSSFLKLELIIMNNICGGLFGLVGIYCYSVGEMSLLLKDSLCVFDLIYSYYHAPILREG